MKIFIANEAYLPNINGCAMACQRLAHGLAERGHQVIVLAPSETSSDRVEFDEKGVKILRAKSFGLKPFHNMYRAVLPFGVNRRVLDWIKTEKPDVVHLMNHVFLGKATLRAAKKLQIPVIGTNHFMPDNLFEYFPKFTQKWLEAWMWRDFIKTYEQLDEVTTPTQISLDLIRKWGFKKPVTVISNGLDLHKFHKRNASEELYKKWNLDPKELTFLFVGRLEKDKNIDLLLHGFKKFLEKRPAQMLIVGTGGDEKMFKTLSKKLSLQKRVTFTGKIPEEELLAAYNLGDIYLASGTAELQGLSIMEAMANTLPILAVNAVAIPELVEEGANGLFFELNTDSLARKMDEISNNSEKMREMGQKSLEKIQSHDIEKTYDAFEKIYEKLTHHAHS